MQMSCLIYLDNFHDMAAFTVNRTFGVRQSYEELAVGAVLYDFTRFSLIWL
jgi:hypothetical protein